MAPVRNTRERGFLCSILILTFVCLAAAAILPAQTPTAVINGTVVDSSGATVPAAKVRMVNQETNVASEKTTGTDGTFVIINLLPGNYVLTVEKTGFKKVALPAFKLEVNQTLTEQIAMQVGDVSETVTVNESAIGVMIQRASTELGTTIDEQQMHELPLNGRNFTQLLILQPGNVPVNTAQGGNGIGNPDGGNIGIPGAIVYRPAVNGAGNRSNAFYMDGIINSDDRSGAWSIPPIADTVQEFKVQSHNNDAQYGNVLGSVVNLVTKSGTNHFHGSAWDFARSQIFDARNPFTGFCSPALCPDQAASLSAQVASGALTTAGASAILSGTPVSPLGYFQNEFGGTIGGPIKKDKTFFYFAYEGWRYSKPNSSFAVIPTAAELGGDFTGTVSPELVGAVNATKTAITPAQIFNPFAETGTNSSVPFYCNSSGAPVGLANPGAAFGTPGYGIQLAGGTPCNRIPGALIDSKLVSVIQAYSNTNCGFTPNLAFAVDNCLDTRNQTDSNNNYDIRVDHRFGTHDTVFGRSYMMWGSPAGIVAGTNSTTPTPYHVWNIGGAWDHVFTPNLIMEVRGGINARPVLVNPVNSQGFDPETKAGYNNLAATAGFFLNIGGYVGSANSGLGNVGPQLRANPESNFNAAMTWVHGKHTVRWGGEYLYENREEINTYETFTSSTAQTCPTNASGLFACGSNQGNALASMLLDLPNALTVNVPNYEEVHARFNPMGFFVQDEWHVRRNLTINVGVRYDYVPPVTLLVNNGETVNALSLPTQQFIIGTASSSAYTTGCGSPQMPPCVPGGLNASNPAFQVTVGGVTYNTLNNIVFSNSQPTLQGIKDNIGPRIGAAWEFLPRTVLRAGFGIFYDTISYRSQNAENTLQGSIWPWTRGVSDTLNNAPMGTSASPTVNPICNSAASCGPYGGYTTSYIPGLAGSNPIVVAPTPWGSTFGGYTNAPDYSDPKSLQWNIQIERQVGGSSMVSVAYVGSHTQRLDWCCFANYPQGGPFCVNNPAQGYTCPTTPLTPAQINQKQYMPFAAQGWHYDESVGFSTYHSLQAQYNRRFSHGLQTLAAFTWSKCLADTNGDYGAENGSEGAPVQYYFAPRLAKGVCAFDIPMLFNWSTVYELPFGHGKRFLNHGWLSQVAGDWGTNFSLLARSGQAFNPTWGGVSNECTLTLTTNCVPQSIGGMAVSSTDPANLSNSGGTISGYSRPSLLSGCNLYANQSVTQWFNPSCFVSPSSLQVGPGYGFGNAPIGNLRSMRFINMDIALVKKIFLTETKQLEFRAEGFNVFNHQVLAVPGASIAPSFSSGAISYGTAGSVTNIASTPRQLQLALKFAF
jgi:hypothetical protein